MTLVASSFPQPDGSRPFVVATDPPRDGLLAEHVEIDGEPWQRGDVFYLMDRHGVPRGHSFQYWNTETGVLVCWRRQRYRFGGRTLPIGFYSGVPSRRVVATEGPDLRFAQIVSDLTDLGSATSDLEADWSDASNDERAELLELAERRLAMVEDAERDDPDL